MRRDQRSGKHPGPGPIRLGAVAAAMLASAAALAADNGAFAGASFAATSSDYDWRLGALERGPAEDDAGFKLMGGLRPLDGLAVEAGYADFGATEAPLRVVCPALAGFPCPQRAGIRTRAVSLSALGILALPLLDVYGRLGVSHWESELDVDFRSTRSSEGTDPVYGAGLQFRVGSFALRLEWERFERSRDAVDMTSLGFTYTFF